MKQKALHVSTECYPAAKAGGMADVVGALPKYLPEHGWKANVVIPKYHMPWIKNHTWEIVHTDTMMLESRLISFTVQKSVDDDLDFQLYAVDLPGLFDRDSIYLDADGQGFGDEPERNIAFQRSVLQWLQSDPGAYALVHCHDHQTGFIPFLMKHATDYSSLREIPTFYTIHNGAYNSRYAWRRKGLFPAFPDDLTASIDWNFGIDSLAAALRYSDHVNTVSPNYLLEMMSDVPALRLFSREDPERFSGILNGIDTDVWNPKTDALLTHKMTSSWDNFKKQNKRDILTDLYQVDGVPLMSFIGRFAYQKGGDLLAPAIERILARFGFVNFFILGSGDKHNEYLVQNLRDRFPERVACYIGYNEDLAHKIYAASDFILMPSRFEPCGLNQLFAMRYGGLPVARQTGGLTDTVVDFESGGYGIGFTYASIDDLTMALARGLHLYKDQKRFKDIRSKATKLDYSWSRSAKIYCEKYDNLKSKYER